MQALIKILKIVAGVILGLAFSFLTVVCLDAILPYPNPFGKYTLNLWLIGPIIAVWLFVGLWIFLRKPSTKKIKSEGIESLPESVSELVFHIIEAMKYRRTVRAEVQQELTDHFTDALADCKNDDERQTLTQELIAEFGDAQLLGTLLRRSKKRCRPLWRTVVARMFQFVGILFLLSIFHFIYLSFAKPSIRVDYLKEAIHLSRTITDENQNAAVLYQKAIDAYKCPDAIDADDTLYKYRDAWIDAVPQEQRQLLNTWYQANTEVMAYVIKGTELPYFWWNYDFSNDKSPYSRIHRPDYLKLDEIFTLLEWRAKEYAAERNYREAFDLLLKMYRFGSQHKGPKTIFDQVVGNFRQKRSMTIARDILGHCSVPLNEISDFRQSLLKLYNDDTFVLDIQTVKYAVLDCIQRIYTDNGQGGGVLLPNELVKINKESNIKGDKNDSFLKILDVPVFSYGFSYVVSLVSADRNQLTYETELLFQKLNDYMQHTPYQIHELKLQDPIDELRNNSKLYQYRYWLVLEVKGLSTLSEKMYKARCQVQATLAVLAILQYQKQQGRFPETLDVLVKDNLVNVIPIDPYSDKPLKYKKTDKGFILYSVGSDFIDDGGVPGFDEDGKPKEWAENGDVIFWPVSTD